MSNEGFQPKMGPKCDRIQKMWLLVCVTVIATLYIMMIEFDLKLTSLRGNGLFFDGFGGDSIPRSINKSTKLILYWNTMFGEKTFYLGDGDIFENCSGIAKGSCATTYNRHAVDIENFDAIIFHGNELYTHDLPRRRRSEQRYIFANLESPANRPVSNQYFEDYFNLTMTYRIDSDIPWLYGAIKEKETGQLVWPPIHQTLHKPRDATDTKKSDNSLQINSRKWSHGKTKAAVWFVSNCQARSGRQNYVNELSNYITVDIYGKCGNKHCRQDQDCFRTVVEPNYFFYLSFENTLCQDYITEKFFNALMYDIVPVVYGGANYRLFAPPDSYINALDFASPRHLAEYLKKLTEQPEDYAKYFKWKERYEVVFEHAITACRLCQILVSNEFEHKTYNPLSMWYSVDKCPLNSILDYRPYVTKIDLNLL